MQDTVVTSIRLPKRLKRRAKVVAAERDTTLNKIVVRLLESYVNEPIRGEVVSANQEQLIKQPA